MLIGITHNSDCLYHKIKQVLGPTKVPHTVLIGITFHTQYYFYNKMKQLLGSHTEVDWYYHIVLLVLGFPQIKQVLGTTKVTYTM